MFDNSLHLYLRVHASTSCSIGLLAAIKILAAQSSPVSSTGKSIDGVGEEPLCAEADRLTGSSESPSSFLVRQDSTSTSVALKKDIADFDLVC